jgi:hypothetical protein
LSTESDKEMIIRNGGETMSAQIQVSVGDFVFIKESVIDSQMQTALLAGKNKTALKWDSYRNLKFKVCGLDEQGLVILEDANGNRIHISGKHLEL